MGQVPYVIVGDGKVARHFRRYFSHLKIGFSDWQNKPTEKCRAVLVLISDSAIESFIEANRHLFAPNQLFVHFSGSLYTELAVGLHPLMTFSAKTDSYSYQVYEQIFFIGEKGRASFPEIFPELPNRFIEIEPAQKPLYHALCVVSGNFTTILWQEVMRMFQKLQLPSDALGPYLEQIFKNLLTNPDQALTGPIARKDCDTIRKNLKALEGSALQDIYAAFVKMKGLSI
ncbi:MAG: 2-dehydropantoate 2-reductase [Clostridiales bacterium]|jgi:predicted short-subunit dehydrogenase-like oxidoreductase (DUF2520 family)|nr:2-dehydropantoate 2-reductase [Clostridiales bacterium]MDN5283609.1 2-dehydropantoate 2-reductase [Candidatus Ozemobacter sp.]